MDTISQFIKLAFIEQKTFAEIESALGISRKQVSQLYDDNLAARNAINKIRAIYKRKGFKNIPFPQFYDAYIKHEAKCRYCEISQAEIDQLFTLNKVYTKRQTTRGRALELERVSPNESYEVLDNLALACYWCNNAKSDEYTDEEFRIIAEGLKKVWQKRIYG